MNNPVNAIQTKVRVADRRTVDAALGRARLSRDEELVLRLRHGLAADREAALEYRGASVELRARLALMEAAVLEHMAETAEAARDAALVDARETRLGALAERLRRI